MDVVNLITTEPCYSDYHNMSEETQKDSTTVNVDVGDGEDLAVAVTTAIGEIKDIPPAEVESIDGLDGEALTEFYQTAVAGELSDITISFCHKDVKVSISDAGTVQAERNRL